MGAYQPLSVEEAVQNNLSLVNLVGMDVPVYAGCPESLTYCCLHPRQMAGVFTPDIFSHATQRG